MRKTWKGLCLLVMGVCLLFSLAWNPVKAYAEGTTGANSLTVTMQSPSYLTDLGGASKIEVDIYKVATLSQSGDTFNVTWIPPFSGADTLSTKLTAAEQKTLAASLATKDNLTGATKITQKLDEKLSGLDNGLYLVIPHEAGKAVTYESNGAPKLTASSSKYNYTFDPFVALVPNGKTTDVTAKIKPSRTTIPSETKKETPSTGKSIVHTGDETKLLPFYIVMVVSGTLLAILTIRSIRDRQNG